MGAEQLGQVLRADRIQRFLPDEHLAICLSIQPDRSRCLELQPYGDRYRQLVDLLIAD